MLSLEEMEKLRPAYDPHAPEAEAEILREIGAPSRAEIVASALDGLHSEDRNVRVLMLRVLAGQQGDEAMRGVLGGLRDDKRRVREVAIKSCLPYLHYPEIAAQLVSIATDPDETRRLRGAALHALTGHGVGASLDELPRAATEALEPLLQDERYRGQILLRLTMLDLSEHVETLLEAFARSGDRKEAALATKALSGYQMVNIGSFDDKAVVEEITRTCEQGPGRVFYWVKRDDLERYRRGRG